MFHIPFWLLAGLLALSAYFWNLGSYGLVGVAQRNDEERLTSDLDYRIYPLFYVARFEQTYRVNRFSNPS